ncbi:MAG: hypothetical protein AAB649_01570, partial [Patescibacteria group bacterium]
GAAKQIKGDLRLAQEYALSQRKLCSDNSTDSLIGYQVEVSTNSYEIFAVCDLPGGGPLDEISIKTETIPTGFTLSRIPVDTIPRFNVLGRGVYIFPPAIGRPDMTIRVTDTNSGAISDIIITSTGEVR